MNPISQLFNIQYPIIQGGMVWTSGWKLASAVSNAGGLGVIGAGSMTLELLKEHIVKCKAATKKPFGVNVPLFYHGVEAQLSLIEELEVPIVFTSAGNPALYTKRLKDKGIIVVQVASSLKQALKSQECGVDAVVLEGFEAGGHNGKDETTTMSLLENARGKLAIPVIAAGGIATGHSMLACMLLGACAVQLGSRFLMTQEASSHLDFKQLIIGLKEGDTILTLKELAPVRMIKNEFYEKLVALYNSNASKEEIVNFLGKGRIKKGVFEGDLNDGELEIGQIASIINDIPSVADLMKRLVSEYNQTLHKLPEAL